MLKSKVKFHTALLAASLAFAPKAAFAVSLVICGNPDQAPCTLSDLLVAGARIVNWLITVSGAYASLWIIVGGFRYVTSMGNGEAVELAKKTIMNALTGMVLVFCAYLLVATVVNSILVQNAQCKTIDIKNPLSYILATEKCK